MTKTNHRQGSSADPTGAALLRRRRTGASGPLGSLWGRLLGSGARKRYLTRRRCGGERWRGGVLTVLSGSTNPISTSLGVRTRRCSALRGSAPTQQDRDWLVAGASEPPRLQPDASVPWATPSDHGLRRCHRRRSDTCGTCPGVGQLDDDVHYHAVTSTSYTAAVARSSGVWAPTDARVRRASCTVAQVVVSGGPSGTRPCKRSMTST